MPSSDPSGSSIFAPTLGQQGWRGRTPRGCSTSCWGRPTSPHIAEAAPNADLGRSLCKQTWPGGFNTDTSCFNDLTLGHRHLVVVQGQGRVDPREHRDGGCGAGEPRASAVPSGASGRMNPNAAFASSEGPSTLPAAGEKGAILF